MGLRARRARWQGATKEHIRPQSVTEEQRSQLARPAARPPGLFLKHALSIPSISGVLPVILICRPISINWHTILSSMDVSLGVLFNLLFITIIQTFFLLMQQSILTIVSYRRTFEKARSVPSRS
jgi:hypothetical protein